MLIDILESVALGFIVAAAPGAVLIESIRRAIFDKTTIRDFTAGNLVGMALLIGGSFVGITTLADNLSVEKALGITGGSVLIILGLKSVLSKPKYRSPHKRVSKLKSRYSSFATGLILAVVNPIRIALWVSLTSVILHEDPTLHSAVAKALSLFAGFTLFYIVLITILLKVGPRIDHKYLLWLSRLLGLVIVAYGISMLVQIVR